jgi:hypothetical protein
MATGHARRHPRARCPAFADLLLGRPPGSFDLRRELAIETDAKHVIKRLLHTTRNDWKHSRPLALSDEGLLADLEKHGVEGAYKLVLETHHGKRRHSDRNSRR